MHPLRVTAHNAQHGPGLPVLDRCAVRRIPNPQPVTVALDRGPKESQDMAETDQALLE